MSFSGGFHKFKETIKNSVWSRIKIFGFSKIRDPAFPLSVITQEDEGMIALAKKLFGVFLRRVKRGEESLTFPG